MTDNVIDFTDKVKYLTPKERREKEALHQYIFDSASFYTRITLPFDGCEPFMAVAVTDWPPEAQILRGFE